MRLTKLTRWVLLGSLVGMASMAQAMDSRKEVVSGGSVANNAPAGVVLDAADAFINPAYMLDYKGMIGMDGTRAVKDFYTGFAFVPLSNIGMPGTLGVQVGRNFGLIRANAMGGGTNLNDIDAGLAASLPNVSAPIDGVTFTDLSDVKSLGLMYALGLGQAVKLGAGFNYIGNGVEGRATPGDPNSANMKKTLSDLEMRVGAEMLFGSAFRLAADLGLGLPGYHFSYSSAALTQSADFSTANIDTNLRAAIDFSKELELVVLGGYQGAGGDLSVVPNAAATANNFTLTRGRNDLYFALGGVFKNPKGLTAIQLGLLSMGFTDKLTVPANTTANTVDDSGIFVFPVIGLVGERSVLDWLTLRGSVQFSSQSGSGNHTAGGVSYTTRTLTSSYLNTSLGASATFDQFVIESVICKNLMFDGPYATGGVANTGLNTSVSVAYLF